MKKFKKKLKKTFYMWFSPGEYKADKKYKRAVKRWKKKKEEGIIDFPPLRPDSWGN